MEKINSITDILKIQSEIIGLYKENIYDFSKCLTKKSNYSIIDFDKVKFKYKYIKNEIRFYCNKKNPFKEIDKDKIEYLFNILDLDFNIYNKRISSISLSEKHKLYFLLKVIEDKDIYIFNNIFECFDKKSIKSIFKMMDILKQDNKLLFINENSINKIYMYVDKILLIDKDGFNYGDSKQILTNMDIIDNYNLSLPDLVAITYYAKEKYNIKLFFHKDVRDIMKDIYKHV